MINYSKIKLVSLDLDGTLLTDHNKISPETIAAIKEKMNSGYIFTFATGRLFNLVTKYAEMLDIKTPLITLDGALIKSFPSDDILFENYLSTKHVLKAIDLANTYGMKIVLAQEDAIYYTDGNEGLNKNLTRYSSKFNKIESYQDVSSSTLEIIISGYGYNKIKYIINKMSFPNSIGLNTSSYQSQSSPGKYYIEIRRKGCDKASGLKKLIKYLNIDISECMVVGDWYNDLSLFKTKAAKVAVANAVGEIKKRADIILESSNNQDPLIELFNLDNRD